MTTPTVGRTVHVYINHDEYQGKPLAGVVVESVPMERNSMGYQETGHINVHVYHPKDAHYDFVTRLSAEEGHADATGEYWKWPPRT